MEAISESEVSRRRKIVQGVEEVSARIKSDFGRAHPADGDLSSSVSSVRLMSAQVLDRFDYGDEGIAWWTQVELYAGLAEPLTILAKGEPLLDSSGVLTFTPPRAYMLKDWGEGVSLGPRFRGQEATAPQNVDSERELFVRPFSEAPSDMTWAKILHWSNRRDS